MCRYLVSLTFLLILIISDAKAENKTNPMNKLSKEKSPYLQQHQNNPVNWFPWGEEAFSAAQKENKPIFLSIGYSTCYWCHVMEKESFESDDVAKVLNKHFISIKVDREERPDVDQIYMDFVVALTGHGGWPMSVFLTPDREPFHGGTYFPKEKFTALLDGIGKTWKEKEDEIRKHGANFKNYLNQRVIPEQDGEITTEALKVSYQEMARSFDPYWAGFGGAPKFPPSTRLQLLARIYKRTGEKKALEMVEQTLDKMARGGIYDHLGGGFHRYSVDKKWLVPHFEKMLYDNALLTKAYLEAYQISKNEMFSSVARETLDYVLTDMENPDGGYYSAEDAGEVGKEGEYYVWSYEELEKALSDKELAKVVEVYDASKEGNFEEHNILNLKLGLDWSAKKDADLISASKKLLAIRDKRVPPHKDDKILTAWNGLMINSMAFASRVLGEEKYLVSAQKAASFIKNKLYKERRLLRRYRDGDARFEAYIDDYAFLIQGLLALYEADHDAKWVDWAIELQAKQDELFLDKESFGYYFASPKNTSLITRKKELADGAIPAGNGVALLNLLKLHDLTYEDKYKKQAVNCLKKLAGSLDKYPSAFASTMLAYDYLEDRSKEVIVVSKDGQGLGSLESYLASSFQPNLIYGAGKPADLEDSKALAIYRGKEIREDKPTVYVCESGTCKLPTTKLEKAKELIEAQSPYKL